MLSASNEPASLFGADGSGLTGKPGDFALDIGRTTQGMGTEGKSGGTAKIPAAADTLGAMTSFTVTGWFKALSSLGGAARFVEYTDPLLSGFCISAGGPGVLSLSINKKMASIPYRSENCFKQGAPGQWPVSYTHLTLPTIYSV